MTFKAINPNTTKTEWETPQDLFFCINCGLPTKRLPTMTPRPFNFQLDACATAENKKCDRYLDKETDALKQSWQGYGGHVWCNPPYGRGIGLWLLKARKEATLIMRVVCLVPASTDTKWWWAQVVPHAKEIHFIKGRLRFGGAKNSAPFASAIIIY